MILVGHIDECSRLAEEKFMPVCAASVIRVI